MELEVVNRQKSYSIDKKRMVKLVKQVLKSENKDASLSIVVTDNREIRRLNRTFLGHDYATDVLSFIYDASGNHVSGEIIVSAEMAYKVAKEHDHDAEGEIALYLIHGLLHLIGYDDKKKGDAKDMHRREKELLSKLGYNISVPD
ncbi:MAG: rRNA maturation RNase YbeY [Planctomycetes bacterium RBG_16_41_13]|nr:MAG: rRNA maturation RNase YbeY [Planctomycetes bacterium RBG_16_41_13]